MFILQYVPYKRIHGATLGRNQVRDRHDGQVLPGYAQGLSGRWWCAQSSKGHYGEDSKVPLCKFSKTWKDLLLRYADEHSAKEGRWAKRNKSCRTPYDVRRNRKWQWHRSQEDYERCDLPNNSSSVPKGQASRLHSVVHDNPWARRQDIYERAYSRNLSHPQRNVSWLRRCADALPRGGRIRRIYEQVWRALFAPRWLGCFGWAWKARH